MPLAVIPWFTLPNLPLGRYVTIQSFGVLTAIGILAAVQLAARAARELGKDPQVVVDFMVVGVLSGVVGGHLVHLLLYHPEELSPVQLLKIWDGLSSMGGLAGGVVAAVVWFRRKRVRFAEYADAFALGMAPGWGVARVGCFTVHDHPGVRSDFLLTVAFPGGARHDLGLYEAIVLFALGAILWTLHRRGILRGRLLALLALLYGVARFLLDFLRADDIVYADRRYAGLTPAQYVAIALVAYGVLRLARRPSVALGAVARRDAV